MSCFPGPEAEPTTEISQAADRRNGVIVPIQEVRAAA